MKKKISDIALMLIMIIMLWVAITTTIQRFKNTEMTETELFLNIPDSFILNWK